MAFAIVNDLTIAFMYVVGWFGDIMDACGMRFMFLSMLTIYMVVRYFLSPLLFTASSDMASSAYTGMRSGRQNGTINRHDRRLTRT